MENSLGLQMLHATEVGAIASARAAGFGNKNKADKAAVEAMRGHLNSVEFSGRVVIGEGERDEAPMLFIGEKLGSGRGMKIDIAVDPLENTNATATLGPRAISTLAASEQGGLFHAPDTYMNKIVVGPESAGKVSLDKTPKENLKAIAKALGRKVGDLVIVVLERERNEKLVANIRRAGARVKLVPDGDLMPGIAASMRGTGIHAVMGIGAAPEGVITAAGLRCIGGEMQARFWPKDSSDARRIKDMGGRVDKIYTHEDLAKGKWILFCATGVTSGEMLTGVRFFGGGARTNSIMLSTETQKVRFIDTTHTFDRRAIKYML